METSSGKRSVIQGRQCIQHVPNRESGSLWTLFMWSWWADFFLQLQLSCWKSLLANSTMWQLWRCTVLKWSEMLCFQGWLLNAGRCSLVMHLPNVQQSWPKHCVSLPARAHVQKLLGNVEQLLSLQHVTILQQVHSSNRLSIKIRPHRRCKRACLSGGTNSQL